MWERAAAKIASSLTAEQLVILSSVPGLQAEFPDEATLIRHIEPSALEGFVAWAQGRMRIKVLGAIEAIQEGVGRVVFGDGRIEQPVRAALAGQGTAIG